MAIGDAALAAGMPLVNGAEAGSAPKIDDYINETRDFIANRTSTVTPVAKGGTGATSAAAARAALGVSAGNTPTGSGGSNVQADLDYLSTQIGNTYRKVDVDTAFGTRDANIDYVQAGNMKPDVYNRVLSGSYRVAYVSAGGTLGWVSSSRTAKEDIETAPIDVQAVLAMEVVTYHRIGAEDGQLEHGLIAEDLHDLGLTWLVDYGAEGDTPQGVRYDLLALALIPAVQSLDARLRSLEDAQ